MPLLVRTLAQPYNLFVYFLYFHLHIYPSATQKSVRVLYLGQAINPTCFQKCQDIVVWLKTFYFDILVF